MSALSIADTIAKRLALAEKGEDVSPCQVLSSPSIEPSDSTRLIVRDAVGVYVIRVERL